MTRTTRIIEWIGGIMPLPTVVTGEGDPYCPEGLFWMDADGLIQGMTMEKPGVLLPLAGASLAETIAQPLAGGSRPTRLRVASPALADVLRHTHPHLDIVCEPTPELDEMLAVMREQMGGEDASPQSYLSAGLAPPAVADFFDAAAELFRTQPWKIVPDDQCLLRVDIEALGLAEAIICVIGQMGESHGFLLFPGIDEFDDFHKAAASLEQGPAGMAQPPKMPRHSALNFERGADLDPALRKEIAAHGWKVASRSAYPWLMVLEENLLARRPAAGELRIFTALSRALAQLLVEAPVLVSAWRGGEPVTRTTIVPTHEGNVEVALHTVEPYYEECDPLLGLLQLELEDNGLEPQRREPFESVLIEQFAESPEYETCVGEGQLGLVLDLAADYMDTTIAGLDAAGLRELLYEIMPRNANIDAPEARGIIRQLRAFYAFVKRAYDFPAATTCLRVLGGTAIAKLEAALSERSKFGMAKSLVLAGGEAGFDMSTPEGIDAWMRSMRGKPVPPSVWSPAVKVTKEKAQKKSKRKAERGAPPKSR